MVCLLISFWALYADFLIDLNCLPGLCRVSLIRCLSDFVLYVLCWKDIGGEDEFLLGCVCVWWKVIVVRTLTCYMFLDNINVIFGCYDVV